MPGGAGCPLFLRAGGFSVLGAVVRRRGRGWEGIWELREKRRKSQLSGLSTPHHWGKTPCRERARFNQQRGKFMPQNAGTRIGGVRYRARSPGENSSAPCPSLLPSPLSGASHPGGSLCSFWGRYPLGCPSCHTNRGMRMGSCSPHSPTLDQRATPQFCLLRIRTNKTDLGIK